VSSVALVFVYTYVRFYEYVPRYVHAYMFTSRRSVSIHRFVGTVVVRYIERYTRSM